MYCHNDATYRFSITRERADDTVARHHAAVIIVLTNVFVFIARTGEREKLIVTDPMTAAWRSVVPDTN